MHIKIGDFEFLEIEYEGDGDWSDAVEDYHAIHKLFNDYKKDWPPPTALGQTYSDRWGNTYKSYEDKDGFHWEVNKMKGDK